METVGICPGECNFERRGRQSAVLVLTMCACLFRCDKGRAEMGLAAIALPVGSIVQSVLSSRSHRAVNIRDALPRKKRGGIGWEDYSGLYRVLKLGERQWRAGVMRAQYGGEELGVAGTRVGPRRECGAARLARAFVVFRGAVRRWAHGGSGGGGCDCRVEERSGRDQGCFLKRSWKKLWWGKQCRWIRELESTTTRPETATPVLPRPRPPWLQSQAAKSPSSPAPAST